MPNPDKLWTEGFTDKDEFGTQDAKNSHKALAMLLRLYSTLNPELTVSDPAYLLTRSDSQNNKKYKLDTKDWLSKLTIFENNLKESVGTADNFGKIMSFFKSHCANDFMRINEKMLPLIPLILGANQTLATPEPLNVKTNHAAIKTYLETIVPLNSTVDTFMEALAVSIKALALNPDVTQKNELPNSIKKAIAAFERRHNKDWPLDENLTEKIKGILTGLNDPTLKNPTPSAFKEALCHKESDNALSQFLESSIKNASTPSDTESIIENAQEASALIEQIQGETKGIALAPMPNTINPEDFLDTLPIKFQMKSSGNNAIKTSAEETPAEEPERPRPRF